LRPDETPPSRPERAAARDATAPSAARTRDSPPWVCDPRLEFRTPRVSQVRRQRLRVIQGSQGILIANDDEKPTGPAHGVRLVHAVSGPEVIDQGPDVAEDLVGTGAGGMSDVDVRPWRASRKVSSADHRPDGA
jgi:hypothetical protein